MRAIVILPAGWGAKVVASSIRFLRSGVRLWLFLTGGIGIEFDTFTGPFANLLFALTTLMAIGVFLVDGGRYFAVLQRKMRLILIPRPAGGRP